MLPCITYSFFWKKFQFAKRPNATSNSALQESIDLENGRLEIVGSENQDLEKDKTKIGSPEWRACIQPAPVPVDEFVMPNQKLLPRVPKPLRKKPSREQIGPDGCLCDHCTAKCCRYFSLPIDEPETMRDFEYLRWYLLHDRATIFVDEGSWYILVHTVCEKLQDDHRCGDYLNRPHICREYTTEECEYEDDYTYELYFETGEQIREFGQAKLGKPDGPEFRSPRPEPLPVLN